MELSAQNFGTVRWEGRGLIISCNTLPSASPRLGEIRGENAVAAMKRRDGPIRDNTLWTWLPVGSQVLLAALANVASSSTLTVFNAWIFRQGYHYQWSLIVVQQMVCAIFAVAQVACIPGEARRVRISRKDYAATLLPFSVVVSLKLYVQNRAFELVTPAFYAMIASTLPVGVTALSVAVGSEPFRVVTCVTAGVVALGGAMIHAGEVALSPAGFALTLVAMSLDVTRLVLVQRLVQPLGLSSVGLMLLSAPLQCVIAAIGAAVLESGSVAAAASAGEFTALAWSLVFLNGALAVVVNLVIFVFVKVASAVAVAVTTPFKDLAVVMLSDEFVVRRRETTTSIVGFALACAASAGYNAWNIGVKDRERKDREMRERAAEQYVPLAGGSGSATDSRLKFAPMEEDGDEDEFDEEVDAHAGVWRIADAHNATLACVGTAVLVTCAAILAQLDYSAVMGR